MKSKIYCIFIVCGSLMLAACGSNNNETAEGNGPSSEDENLLATFGSQSEDDTPLPITQQLDDDIQNVFGDADNAVTDVFQGDTVQSVIDRARSF